MASRSLPPSYNPCVVPSSCVIFPGVGDFWIWIISMIWWWHDKDEGILQLLLKSLINWIQVNQKEDNHRWPWPNQVSIVGEHNLQETVRSYGLRAVVNPLMLALNKHTAILQGSLWELRASVLKGLNAASNPWAQERTPHPGSHCSFSEHLHSAPEYRTSWATQTPSPWELRCNKFMLL